MIFGYLFLKGLLAILGFILYIPLLIIEFAFNVFISLFTPSRKTRVRPKTNYTVPTTRSYTKAIPSKKKAVRKEKNWEDALFDKDAKPWEIADSLEYWGPIIFDDWEDE